MYAVVWMAGALASFCLMAVGARELSGSMSTFQILFIRSVIGLLVVAGMIWLSGDRQLFRTARPGLQVVRNLFHFGGQYGWFVGIGLLPLAEVFALEFTVPVWTALMAALFLQEKLTPRRMLGIALGLLGVLIIVRPGVEIMNPAAFIVLGAAVGYAVAHSCTKLLSRTEKPLTILFYMCLVQLPMGFLLSVFAWTWPSTAQWAWNLLVGLTALSAHFCMTKAMQRTEVGTVVTLDFLRLPLIAMVGVLFYGESFDMALLIGAACMLLGNLVNLYKPRAV